jgi:hypothetical protein
MGRKQGHRWQPGGSGNPLGWAKSSGNIDARRHIIAETTRAQLPDKKTAKRGMRGRAATLTNAAARASGKRLPGPAPGAGARPINLAMVARCAEIGCTIEEIATVLGFSRSNLYERMDAQPEIREAIDRGRNLGKVRLRLLQWRSAMAGNVTMLIWLGRQVLGQKDRPETEHGTTKGLEQVLREMHARRKGSAT